MILTEEQRKLVDDNYLLIYSFAKEKHISLEQYHGILAIGLCKAGLIYDDSKGAFSTLAYSIMDAEYKMHLRRENTLSRIGDKTLVYQNGLKEGEEALFNQQDTTFENKIIFADCFKRKMQILNNREKQIVEMLLSGMLKKEIMKELGIASSSYWRSMQRIKEVFKGMSDKEKA